MKILTDKENKIRHQKNVLINHIDIKYRELEDFDNQFEIIHNILFNLDTKELKKILSLTKAKVNYEKSVRLSSRN
tara:strand:+ start:1679 stop:1903 length:225 start_codon:yes stop_codon:yes gene_type:complete